MQKINKNKNKKNLNKLESKKISYYIPIIFIIIVVPIIVYCKIITLPKEIADFWRNGTSHADFYSYYKAIALIIGTVAAVIAYGGLFLNGRLPLQKEKRYYLFIFIYSIFVIISSINAQNKDVAIEGFPDMYQGVFVLLSYVILLFILLNYTRNEMDIKIIVYSFVILTVIEGVLGLSQYFGFDFLQSGIGKSLITPKEIDSSTLRFIFGKHTIYGTMYNTNFVGSFGALVLPLTTVIYLNEKERKKTIMFGLVALLAFATWLGCNSRAGYLGITAGSIVGIIVFKKIIKKEYKKILILFIGFISITLIFNIVSGGRVFNQFSRLNPVIEAEKLQSISEQQLIRFEEVSTKDNTFTIKTNKETIVGVMQDSVLSFKDEDENKLDINTDKEGKITFLDEKYEGYNFTTFEDRPAYIKAELYGRKWDLYTTGDQKFKVISFNNKITDPVEAPRIKLFDGRETFASNRGYIFSRTIPMLKDTLLIGYGPDNYPMVFPQEDYVGRFNVGSYGMLDIIIDKPHNMYLQTAINTGVISLLALLAIWGMYLFDSFKIYIKGNMESFTEYMGAAIFLSITAYLTAGLFNDNIISVAPLFWILLGTGIGINGMLKTNKSIN
ncbi:O-antigen ligase family protein [Sedimentibacter sp.]|uniref:O-antigen ligase family protein n=1 Tax=Sedimentibacter sp. TaxID=1960295 RepID=UPI00289837B5|nr:O-antigen ligase family protein [Sedimentibacter sp.]